MQEAERIFCVLIFINKHCDWQIIKSEDSSGATNIQEAAIASEASFLNSTF